MTINGCGKCIAISIADFGVNANGREYKLDFISKEELEKIRISIDAQSYQLFTEDDFERIKKTLHTHRPIGTIAHGSEGAKGLLNMALGAMLQSELKVEPRIVNGRVISWDVMGGDIDIPADAIVVDSLGGYNGIRVGDPFIGRKVNFFYEALGGHHGTTSDIDWWENKEEADKDSDYEIGKRAKEQNVDTARLSTTGKSPASAIMKKILGSKS